MDLDGLRILVTRPAGRADDLMRAIAAAGGSSAHIPLLTVDALDSQRDAALWQHTEQTLRRLAHYRRVIAISVNAVHYGMRWIAAALQQSAVPHALQLPAHIAWYGIGAATLDELKRWGIEARGGAAGATSEALLALPELQTVRGEAILILRGVGGRETLASVLRERGAAVEYAECYRRSVPQLDAAQRQLLQRAAFDAVCVNSAETLRNLWHYLTIDQDNTAVDQDAPTMDQDAATINQNIATMDRYAARQQRPPNASPAATAPVLQRQYQRMALIVPSERVAQLAVSLGFVAVVEAANAGTAATLTALREINKQRIGR